MLDLVMQGGGGMVPVLLFGLIALVTAGLFVWRPEPRKLAYLRGMSVATIFAILAAVAADLSAALHHTAGDPERWGADWHLALLVGLGESLAPAILGFALLALVWMLAAFGMRRFEGE
jgi:hypothetical protein